MFEKVPSDETIFTVYVYGRP